MGGLALYICSVHVLLQALKTVARLVRAQPAAGPAALAKVGGEGECIVLVREWGRAWEMQVCQEQGGMARRADIASSLPALSMLASCKATEPHFAS